MLEVQRQGRDDGPALVTWGFAFQVRQYVRGSLWVVPAAGVLIGLILAEVSVALDHALGDAVPLTYSAGTATSVLSANIGAMAALAGFVVTVAVLAVQTASSSFSARYMRLWYRDGMLKGLLALLIGTLAFSLSTIRFVESSFVPNLTVTVAGIAVVAGLLFFVVFLDRFLHRLRPVAVAALVAEAGRRSFDGWMDVSSGAEALLSPRGSVLPSSQPLLVVHAKAAGNLQAIDARGLAAFARTQHCLLVFEHAIGDFVPRDAALLRVYGEHLPTRASERLTSMLALGDERTIDQDPVFALRVMVDVADRALSPGINDPTTAVQILDYLAETLRMVGTTEMPAADAAVEPPAVGVLMPMRRWEEYLEIGVSEIREYGATSVPVVRRLRALLLELVELVPAHREAAVLDQLRRLDATVQRAYAGNEDLDLAMTPDRQGMGGPQTPGEAPVSVPTGVEA
jgi:uncharacterized membrane protein